jgi:hypothetical protein
MIAPKVKNTSPREFVSDRYKVSNQALKVKFHRGMDRYLVRLTCLRPSRARPQITGIKTHGRKKTQPTNRLGL